MKPYPLSKRMWPLPAAIALAVFFAQPSLGQSDNSAEKPQKFYDPFLEKEVEIEQPEKPLPQLEDRDVSMPELRVERLDNSEAKNPKHTLRQIEAGLYRPVKIDAINLPLTDVADQLSGCCRIPIEVDKRALEDVGIDPQTPITIKFDGITLHSALRLMLRELELTYQIYDEAIFITTPECDSFQYPFTTRYYPVTDLATFRTDDGRTSADAGRITDLTDILVTKISLESWDNFGGPGSISTVPIPNGIVLVVVQTSDVHLGIAQTLKTIRKIIQMESTDAAETGTSSQRAKTFFKLSEEHPKITAGNRRIATALQLNVRLKAVDQPLTEVIDQLSKTCDIPIMIDHRALFDVGLDPKASLTCNVEGMTLHETLRAILKELELTYIIQNEVLLITTPEEAEMQLETRLYPITDLTRFETKDGETFVDTDPLIDMITVSIDPSTWDCVGGPGSLAPMRIGDKVVMVVSQTRDAQEEIVVLLRKLRKVNEQEKRPTPFYHKKPEPQTGGGYAAGGGAQGINGNSPPGN